MSENPTQSPEPAAPQPPSGGRSGLPVRSLLTGTRLAVAALALAAIATTAAGIFWKRSDNVSRETARRLQQGDARAGQLEAQLRQSLELTRELQSRAAVMESKLTEVLTQQAQLERMYQSIARDGILSVLSDVESSVALASQQLAVSGNVLGAIVALQDADTRLKRFNQPEAVGLRRLIARDIERLRAVPVVDVIAIVVRLDATASAAGQLPLLATLSPAQAAREPGAASGAPQAGSTLERLAASGWRGWRSLVGEISQLLRVSRVDEPDAVLLAPEQQYFVRENLRLRLLSARLALLSRAEPVYRNDLRRAIDWIGAYYDRSDKGVANAISSLEQLESNRLVVELPSLGETVTAIRTARAARERN